VLPKSLGHATVGVLVQTNFGGILRINGAPVGESLGKYYLHDLLKRVHDGSCMIVVATDAPLDSRQLKRVARRALYGLVRAGGISTHGSGDYVLAFSTAQITHAADAKPTDRATAWPDEKLSPIFLAAAEATEEAIYHSLFAAENMSGHRGTIQALPQKKVFEILEHHRLLRLRSK
jgi:D-aminopeptidase